MMKPSLIFKFVPFLLCVLIGCATTASQSTGENEDPTEPALEIPEPESLGAMLDPIHDSAGIPAIGAAVVSGDGLLAVGAVGMRKSGDDTAVTTEDKFHLGSCTKAMTATLMGVLVQDGILDWDTTLEQAFDHFADSMHEDYRSVTLRQLLAHRGGAWSSLGQHPAIWNPLFTDQRPLTEQRNTIAEAMLREAPEVAPGTQFVYSNAGYIVVGAAMERATGESWEDLLTNRVFAPLEMNACGFGPPASVGQVDQPWGHTSAGGSYSPVEPGPYADNPRALGPAGTVHCTLGDWGKFISAHLRGVRGEPSLLPADIFEQLHSPEPQDDYGYGWFQVERTWAQGRAFSHDGSNTMFYAQVWAAPNLNRAFFVTTNAASSEALEAINTTVTSLFETYSE